MGFAHYARVNQDNTVVFVTPLEDKFFTDENGVQREDLALKHLYETIPDSVEDRWIKTSYNGEFRVRFAALGGKYLEENNAFTCPKPYDSWIFNEEILDWVPPHPCPEMIDENNPESPMWIWDESIKDWIKIW